MKKALDIIKITLLLVSSLTVMAGATIAPSLPQMARIFDQTSYAETLTKLVLTIPAIFIAVSGPFSGLIIDRFGRKQLLLASLVLYALAGSSGLYLDNIYLILIGRALLGVAVAGTMTVATTLIGDYYEGEERNQFLGQQAAYMALGGVVFVSLGGILADFYWRYPFGIYLFSLGLLPLVYLFIEEPDTSTFAHADRAHPDLKSVSPYRTVIFVYGVAFLSMLAFYMIPVQIPFLLDRLSGVSNTWVGLAISTSTIAGAIASFNYEKIKARYSYPMVFAIAFALHGLGYLIISLSAYYIIILLGLFVAGAGLGLALPHVNLWIMEISPTRVRGRLVGGITSAVFLGQFLSPLVVAPLLLRYTLSGLFALVGFVLILLVGAILYGVRFLEEEEEIQALKQK